MKRSNFHSLLTSAAIALVTCNASSASADEGLPPGLQTLVFTPVTTPAVAREIKILNEEGEPPRNHASDTPMDAGIGLQAQARQQDEGLPRGHS
jgi:hypothetical protein